MAAIRHLTQLNNRLVNECGQTCVAMLANAYNGTALTVEQVARETGTDKGRFTPFYPYNILNPDGSIKERVPGLHTMLGHYGIKAAYTGNATWEWYQQKMTEGVPVIALGAHRTYGDIGHFLIVAAYTSSKVIVFDPLAAVGPTDMPLGEFINFINTPSVYVGGRNRPNQAMYPVTPLAAPLPPETRTAILGLREAGYAMLQRAG